MLSKPPLRVISQDQLGIQLSGTSILTKLPKNDGLPGPGTFSAKTRNVSGKPETICHPLNAARVFCTFFFFFAIVSLVKDSRVEEELETEWLNILMPMREVYPLF